MKDGTRRRNEVEQFGEQVLQRAGVVADPVVGAELSLGGVFEAI